VLFQLFANDDDDKKKENIFRHVAKKSAKKMMKKLAKKAAKAIMRLIKMIIKKILLKVLGWVVAYIGLPTLLIILCVVIVAAGALYIGSLFGWFDSDSGVDVEKLKARYEDSAKNTAELEIYRTPIWIIQNIDNLRIIKEDKEPEDIDPESISKLLTAEQFLVQHDITTTTWNVSNGTESTHIASSSQTSFISSVSTWNRLFTYKYKPLDNIVTVITTKSNGIITTVTNTSAWVDDGTDIQAESLQNGYEGFVHYKYKQISSSNKIITKAPATPSPTPSPKPSPNASPSSTPPIVQVTSTRTESHKIITNWVLDEIDNEPNYEKFDFVLKSYNVTKTDFEMLEDIMKDNDPELETIQGYSSNGLASSPDDFLLGQNGDGDIYNGGTLADSPIIPGSSDWAFPTNTSARMSDPFGMRFDPYYLKNRLHKGQDIARSPADRDKGVNYTIYAVENGTIERSDCRDDGYGCSVLIDHGSGIKTRYGHMKVGSLQTKAGDIVTKGKALGIMGNTGGAVGVHLHFEVIINGTPVNPLGYLRK
jgi:murein DD-endopeptidase MepM/ murein hydrolase activator NlpD